MMKETLFKSVFGIAVLGIAVSAHAIGLVDNAVTGPTLSAGEIATFSAEYGANATFTDNWVFGLGPNLGVGANVNPFDVTIGVTPILNLNPFTVALYDANASGKPSGPALETGANINIASLPAGEYDLQVTGTASGTSGGIYAGVITATTVPLPAAAWLLLSGLAGVGLIGRRRLSA